MDKLSKEYVLSFFDKTLLLHGDRPEALRWTPEGQKLRFQCMLEIEQSIKGKSVLDFGCGKGDFYKFLKDRGINVNYTGFDINENMIFLARNKYPECSFRVFDIDKDDLDEKFDYIFLCGVFNLKIVRLEKVIKKTLIKLFSHCRIAMAFNALSAHKPSRMKSYELNYLYPEDMMKFAVRELSPHVSILHDRIPYDFTMFVRRNHQSQA